jgi:hypothetical protein
MVTIVFELNLGAYFASAAKAGECRNSQSWVFVHSKPNVLNRPNARPAVDN